MPKATEAIDQEYDDYYDEEITDDDFGIILGPNGELKSVFLPTDETAEIPETFYAILEIFGISDVSEIEGKPTIH